MVKIKKWLDKNKKGGIIGGIIGGIPLIIYILNSLGANLVVPEILTSQAAILGLILNTITFNSVCFGEFCSLSGAIASLLFGIIIGGFVQSKW